MKILRLSTLYPAYVDFFYQKNPEMICASYSDQLSALYYDAFGQADFWKNAFNKRGVDFLDIVANVEPLQSAWISENEVKFTANASLLEICGEQVKKYSPEILFLTDYSTFNYDFVTSLKQSVPSIRLVLGWCGAPFNNPEVFNAYDVVLSCIPELVESFKAMGHHAIHVNHAFEPRVLERIDLNRDKVFDFTFCGQIVRRNQFHLNREKLLEKLVAECDIKLFTPSALIDWQDELYEFAARVSFDLNQLFNLLKIPEDARRKIPLVKHTVNHTSRPLRPVNSKLKPAMRPPVFGLEMFQTLRDSKVTLNNHIDISARYASNMRLFEATGVGTCLLTDWKENVDLLFEPDYEIITYRSPEECVDKAKWLIDNPQKCEEIALAGQLRTLREHSFERRAEQLMEIIEGEMK